MQFQRILSGLRFRITLAVTLALIVILGAATLWRYERHRQMDLEEAHTQVTAASAIILAGMQYALERNDVQDLESMVKNIGAQPGVRGIYLADANGALRLYHQSVLAGTGAIPLVDSTSLAAWIAAPADTSTDNMIYAGAAGEQILRRSQLIQNQPACYGCHDARQPILGALVTDFALTETNYQLAADLEGSITTGIATILAVVVAINLLLSRFVLDKLEQFTPVLKRFGQGDLSERLTARGEDEIGQLAVRFNQMADGLETRANENAQLYTELASKEAARASLLHQVIVAQEEEHKSLARELHDGLAQTLTALSVTVQSAVQIIPTDMLGVHERLARVQALTQETLMDTARWIQDLRPRMLDDLGLVPALRAYGEARFQGTATRVYIETTNMTQRLPPEIEITLFRVMQEALSNIAKHAQARRVDLRIERYGNGVIVAHVQDDGVGFIPARYLQAPEGLRGMGLLGMRERTALLGGTLHIESTPGRGTRLRIEVPWQESVP